MPPRDETPLQLINRQETPLELESYVEDTVSIGKDTYQQTVEEADSSISIKAKDVDVVVKNDFNDVPRMPQKGERDGSAALALFKNSQDQKGVATMPSSVKEIKKSLKSAKEKSSIYSSGEQQSIPKATLIDSTPRLSTPPMSACLQESESRSTTQRRRPRLNQKSTSMISLTPAK